MLHPLRMLTGMTEIAASITRSAGGGKITRAAIRPMMVEEMTRRSRLVEEEPAKDTEMDHHSRRPEEMGINLVLHPDKRVSLMVMYRVPRLLKFFPPWPSVSKNRRDCLLR